jgi:hypothetical protein
VILCTGRSTHEPAEILANPRNEGIEWKDQQ